MTEPAPDYTSRLRVLHVLRSPVGGLFRHVVDLAGEQIRLGHAVGLVADASTGDARADSVLAGLEPALQLGLIRFPMRRDPHPADLGGIVRVARLIEAERPDVVHGHGSKGALFARAASLLPWRRRDPVRAYTPHGGSLHYDPRSLRGAAIIAAERLLARRSDLVLFESHYAAARFGAVVGQVPGLTRTVHNGVREAEFAPVAELADGADFVYVGELRRLKGIDLLLEALAGLACRAGLTPRLVVVGDGPDRAELETLVHTLGLGAQVCFAGPLPARHAFALGRTVVVPSRAESLPYIVLEAAAARRPLIATNVGGIPEIFGPERGRLVEPDDADALRDALRAALREPESRKHRAAADLAGHVRDQFGLARMTAGVMTGYREALARKVSGSRQPVRSVARTPRVNA